MFLVEAEARDGAIRRDDERRRGLDHEDARVIDDRSRDPNDGVFKPVARIPFVGGDAVALGVRGRRERLAAPDRVRDEAA